MTTWTPDRIKLLRKTLGESQEEFARHFRVTVDSVRAWEQAKGNPGGPATVILDQLAGIRQPANGRPRKEILATAS